MIWRRDLIKSLKVRGWVTAPERKGPKGLKEQLVQFTVNSLASGGVLQYQRAGIWCS